MLAKEKKYSLIFSDPFRYKWMRKFFLLIDVNTSKVTKVLLNIELNKYLCNAFILDDAKMKTSGKTYKSSKN